MNGTNTPKLARCPKCNVIVGLVVDGRTGAFSPNDAAAEPRDGWRCTAHARTPAERRRESLEALAQVEGWLR